MQPEPSAVKPKLRGWKREENHHSATIDVGSLEKPLSPVLPPGVIVPERPTQLEPPSLKQRLGSAPVIFHFKKKLQVAEVAEELDEVFDERERLDQRKSLPVPPPSGCSLASEVFFDATPSSAILPEELPTAPLPGIPEETEGSFESTREILCAREHAAARKVPVSRLPRGLQRFGVPRPIPADYISPTVKLEVCSHNRESSADATAGDPNW